MLRSLIRIGIMVATVIIALEAFWYSTGPEQRRQYLVQINRDDLAHWLETDEYQPLIPQLWEMRQRQQSVQPPVEDGQHSEVARETGVQQQIPPSGQSNADEVNQLAGTLLNHIRPKVYCGKAPTRSLESSKKSIYKWTDEQGRVHFGERPAGNGAEDLSDQYGRLTKTVSLQMEYPSWAGDPVLEREIHKQGKLVYRVLKEYIPEEHLRQINLKIVMFQDKAAFDRHKADKANSGFWGAYYNQGQNTIYLPRYPYTEQTLAIARHEMTHAMVAGMLGRLPVWMGEGIAEYMESFEWNLSAAVARPVVHDVNQFRGYSLASLASATDNEFYGDGHNDFYRLAALSTYFLMDHSDGRRWLKKSYEHFADKPCDGINGETLFALYYPGGVQAADKQWQRWLKRGKFKTHRY